VTGGLMIRFVHLTGRFDLNEEKIEKAFLLTWNLMAKVEK
jgi:hypothetical protein